MSNDIRIDDAEFAERFVHDHGANLKFITEDQRWVQFRRGKWTTAKKYDLAKQTTNKILQQLKGAESNADYQALAKLAGRYRNTGPVDQALRQAEELLSVSKSDFDTDPYVINCKNGVIDLRTKERVEHDGQMVLKQCSVEYNPEAKRPERWLQFLDEIFEGNKDLIEYVRLGLGYTLTGLDVEHCFFLLHGNGRNGKDKLVNVVRKIMGTYAQQIEFETLLAKDQSSVRVMAMIGKLQGLRLAQASETENNRRFAEALVKKLTGGNALTGTRLHKDDFTFEPTHRFWLCCNHRPAIKDATDGMWERVRVVPFHKQYLGDARDLHLETKLFAEREGIFAWLVNAAHDYLKQGRLPKIPQACVEAVEAYRDENDILSRFIREQMVKEQGATVGVQATYGAHVAWCFANELEPKSKQYFRDAMGERSVHAKLNRNKSWDFQNFRLREDEPKQPEFEPAFGEMSGQQFKEWFNG